MVVSLEGELMVSKNDFKNRSTKWKKKQEIDNSLFISSENYFHPGWIKIDPITKAYNLIQFYISKDSERFHREVEALQDSSIDSVIKRVKSGGVSSLEPKAKRLYNAAVSSRGIFERDKMRVTLQAKPVNRRDFKPSQTAQRKSWNTRYYMSHTPMRSQGLKMNNYAKATDKLGRNLRNSNGMVGLKVFYNPASIMQFTESTMLGISLLQDIYLNEWTRKAAKHAGEHYTNIKGNTSKSKYFKKRVNIQQDNRNIYNLIGKSIHSKRLENKGIVNMTHSIPHTPENWFGNTRTSQIGMFPLRRYVRFIIGSWNHRSEWEAGITPKGVFASNMKKSGKSLTEIKSKTQGPFMVHTNGRAIPFGKGTKPYRRLSKAGFSFRKLKRLE